MEVLVVGDLHIGKRHKATYGDATVWDERSLDILSDLIDKEKPTRLILAGDVFDTSKPTSLDFAKLVAVLTKVLDVYIIAGNHDLSMIKEDTAFSKLSALSNITIVEPNDSSVMFVDKHGVSYLGVGWCSTQTIYEEVMHSTIDAAQVGDIIITHANRVSWQNDNDNSFTDELYERCKEIECLVLSGHEHKSSQTAHFIHLGSVVPHTIAEVGERYYWCDGLHKIDIGDDIILSRDEPDVIDPDKVYYIRPKKEVTVEDLAMEQKDLTIDILEDFIGQAKEAGFEEEIALCLEN
jgi:DNA repair exonuclease SbcCD nuclease subunit